MRYQSAEEMLNDIEQVLRTVFNPVGQTELKRWLAALGARDGQLPMAKGAQTPPHGRLTGTGEMEGKDVVLEEVDAEEATSLASIDGPGGEMRQRMTRPRAAEELTLPVPHDDESALSGRMSPLEFPLPLSDTEERPGRRRVRGGGGFSTFLFGLLLIGGAAFAGRYFGLLREKQGADEPPPSTVTPANAAEAEASKADKARPAPGKHAIASSSAVGTGHDGGAAAAATHLATRKAEAAEPPRAPPHHVRGLSEKPEHLRRIDELKNMMAPDPSLDPMPAPSEPATAPANP
jgi:hypothetical protein